MIYRTEGKADLVLGWARCQLWLLVLAALFHFACTKDETPTQGGRQARGKIMVSAAASLQDAFREIGAQFEKRTGSVVRFNFGASGALQKQIESGAPVDVFASAGRPQMEALAAGAFLISESQRDFARNELVLIVPGAQAIEISSFADLSKNQVKRIAIGNPKTVPAGQYAEQSLSRLGIWQQLQSRLVQAEDVRQVLDYVTRNEVEAGIVYASDVRPSEARIKIAARAPEDSHLPILYPIALIKSSQQRATSQAFIDAVVSDEGQSILEKHGFRRVR